MTEFDDFADDLMDDAWDSLSDCDDMELMLVPEEVEHAGNEAIDNFIHKEVMRNMDKDVYNEG